MDLEKNSIALRCELSKAREKIGLLEAENRGLGEEIRRLGEENRRLMMENKRLKEEMQKLRLEVFGLKPSKKGKYDCDESSDKSEGKRLGPPFGHEGRSRSRPEKVDKKVVLGLKSCPHCSSTRIKPLKPRYRYKEDIVPVKLFVTEFEIGQYYCPSCDKMVYPDVPEVIDNCRFGIMFLLYVTYLRYVLNLPMQQDGEASK